MSTLSGMYNESIHAEALARSIEHSIRSAGSQNPEVGRLLSLMAEGFSLADILDLGDHHKEALFQLGCRLMASNSVDEAAAIFTTLALLDPLEARAVYGLGIAEQSRGNHWKASQIFLQFVALDATNPHGPLRLGECLLMAGEIEEARAAFATALKLAGHGQGDPALMEEASRQLKRLEGQCT